MTHKFTLTSIISITITVAFLVLASIMFAHAEWVDPSVPPTGGNVAAPINVGAAPQIKEGSLIINSGAEVTGLGVLNGKALDLSGPIRIVNSDATLAPNGAGSTGDYLRRTSNGMEWTSEAPSVVSTAACLPLAETSVPEKETVAFDVPSACKDHACNLYMVTEDINGAIKDIRGGVIVEHHVGVQQKDSNGNDVFWWTKMGGESDGTDCSRGQNGTTKDCSKILKNGNTFVLRDDDPGTTGGENLPGQWSLRDGSTKYGLSLYICG